MDDMYQQCMSHMNRRVRIHTCHGECYEGVIVNVDNHNVYLQPIGGVQTLGKGKGKVYTSGWYGYGAGAGILALSLYVLLALVLI